MVRIRMFVFHVLFLVILFFVNVLGRELTEKEYFSLPDLFYLDNYEKCLSHDGVYCLGTFHVTPQKGSNPVYKLMEEYSEETYAFNHTLIHRGFCITTRCPEFNSTNRADNFLQCTRREVANLSMRANLTVLKYCQTRADAQRFETISTAQIAFLAAVVVILIMNIVGTAYDFRTKDDSERMPILMAWSAIKNWKVLTEYDNKAGAALTALHGIRVCVAISTCLSHSALLFFSLYLYDPQVLEHVAAHPLSMFVQNSTCAEQMFVVISGFMHAAQLRSFAKDHRVSYRLLPIMIARRIVRLAPVFLLAVSFAATWWPVLSSGPLWAATVGAESQICKKKFWAHVLFVNNLVQANEHCVMPTWYMAVDVQLHIMTTFLMLLLLQFPRWTLTSLVVLFGASCIMNAALAYAFDWVPLLYLSVSPENLRTLFHDVPSFYGFYISPWGSISASLLGLILGYLYYDMKDSDFIIGRYKWVLKMSSMVSCPLLAAWILLGFFLQHVKAKAFAVAYVTLERSIFQILVLMSYIVLSVIGGFALKVLSWRGWHALSRMSLPVMTVHWLVNLYLVGSAPQPMSTSIMDICIYGVSTAVYTFIFAVPITLFVEIPVKRFFEVFAS